MSKSLNAKLKYARKQLNQRKYKPLAKHGNETLKLTNMEYTRQTSEREIVMVIDLAREEFIKAILEAKNGDVIEYDGRKFDFTQGHVTHSDSQCFLTDRNAIPDDVEVTGYEYVHLRPKLERQRGAAVFDNKTSIS